MDVISPIEHNKETFASSLRSAPSVIGPEQPMTPPPTLASLAGEETARGLFGSLDSRLSTRDRRLATGDSRPATGDP